MGVEWPCDFEPVHKSPGADPIITSGPIYQVLPARIVANVHQVKVGDVGTVNVERNKGAIVRKEHILGRLVSPSPSIPSCCVAGQSGDGAQFHPTYW